MGKLSSSSIKKVIESRRNNGKPWCSEETRKKISMKKREWYKIHSHPKGALGKHWKNPASSERMKNNNPMFNSKIIKKFKGNKNCFHNPEITKKCIETKRKNGTLKHSELTKIKIGLANNGKKRTKKTRILQRKHRIEYLNIHPEKHPCIILNKMNKHSYPHKLLENYLKELKIDFISEYPIKSPIKHGKYYIDCYLLKYNIAIECDGEYFHKNEEKDKKRDKFVFQEHKIKTIRILAKIIMYEKNKCLEMIKNAIS